MAKKMLQALLNFFLKYTKISLKGKSNDRTEDQSKKNVSHSLSFREQPACTQNIN